MDSNGISIDLLKEFNNLLNSINILLSFLTKHRYIEEIIRMIANNLTVLPSIRKCDIKEKNPFHVGGCCDLMFSGHTLTCLIATLYYLYYVSDKYTTLLLLFNFVNQFLILANRRHYSDDVFLAWFVTLTVFFIRTNEPNKVIKGLFSAIKNIFPHK